VVYGANHRAGQLGETVPRGHLIVPYSSSTNTVQSTVLVSTSVGAVQFKLAPVSVTGASLYV
jgi:hypothetical protein